MGNVKTSSLTIHLEPGPKETAYTAADGERQTITRWFLMLISPTTHRID